MRRWRLRQLGDQVSVSSGRDGLTVCSGAGTVVVTILAGPLNYAGENPKVAGS